MAGRKETRMKQIVAKMFIIIKPTFANGFDEEKNIYLLLAKSQSSHLLLIQDDQ